MRTASNIGQSIAPLACALLTLAQIQAATVVWINPGSGNWNDTNNWAPNQVPGSGDEVIITNSGTYAVTVNVSVTLANLTLGGLSGTQTLVIPSSTLTLQTNGSVGGNGVLALSGGTLSGAGTLTVSGVMNWTAGRMDGRPAKMRRDTEDRSRERLDT